MSQAVGPEFESSVRCERPSRGCSHCRGNWQAPVPVPHGPAPPWPYPSLAVGFGGGRPRWFCRTLTDAMVAGLPPCSGVALDLDRRLMLEMGAESAHQALPFPANRTRFTPIRSCHHAPSRAIPNRGLSPLGNALAVRRLRLTRRGLDQHIRYDRQNTSNRATQQFPLNLAQSHKRGLSPLGECIPLSAIATDSKPVSLAYSLRSKENR
jgi:hypothetical protein